VIVTRDGVRRSGSKHARLIVVAVLTMAASVSGVISPASGATGPAYGKDFPDPHVLVVGGVFYAYSTNVPGMNVPVTSSTNLTSWTATSDALRALPQWATPGRTWAPTVLARGGAYVLYYTVEETSTGLQCLSVATASSPRGPFKDRSSGPLVCQFLLGGSIDPYVFSDSQGSSYLLWKSDDNALGHLTSLWGQSLASNGTGFALRSSPVRLLTQTAPWQAPAMEGPAMVKSPTTYYLFYGANKWYTSSSAIGYATCSTPLGPCVDQSTSGPWFATSPTLTPPLGPQGPTVFTDSTGTTRLGFSAWNGTPGYPNGVRALWIAPLTFPNGQPTLG
jgi:beta-xylosidase